MYFVCNASALISPKAKNESVLRVKHWSCMTAGECFFLKHNFFIFLATIVLFLFVFSFAGMILSVVWQSNPPVMAAALKWSWFHCRI